MPLKWQGRSERKRDVEDCGGSFGRKIMPIIELT